MKLFVDYNSVVTNGQVVALIDPLVYEATYKSAVAQLHSNQAKLVLAEKTLVRKRNLFAKQMCSEADLDAAIEARDTTKAAVEQSEASVSKAKADLDYCTIRSPVNGVVIARKVEEGETVVSSYNAVPVLTIAEDLNVIWVEATVPEADVGNIKVGQEVTFTADAYRKRFKGRVVEIVIEDEKTLAGWTSEYVWCQIGAEKAKTLSRYRGATERTIKRKDLVHVHVMDVHSDRLKTIII